MLQRKTVQMLKAAGEMGKLEREAVLEPEVQERLRQDDLTISSMQQWVVLSVPEVEVYQGLPAQ